MARSRERHRLLAQAFRLGGRRRRERSASRGLWALLGEVGVSLPRGWGGGGRSRIGFGGLVCHGADCLGGGRFGHARRRRAFAPALDERWPIVVLGGPGSACEERRLPPRAEEPSDCGREEARRNPWHQIRPGGRPDR